jgi:putative PIG3 family NAD(P)H quinone oxidoreductase
VRAVVIAEPGGPDVLRLAEVPDPVAEPGDVIIDVAAAGLNRADLMQRRGMYPPPPGASPYPGLECSGRVAGIGQDVGDGYHVADEVCALLAGGGYAEKVAVPAAQVLPVPRGVTLTEAAALPEVACTVYANVFQQAALAPGETLLVHGGASGIGTMAIQLAKALGARVACTAGSPAKLQRCRELGADLAVNYAEEDFVEAISDFTSGRGADVILDIVGAAYLQRNVTALGTGGRLVVIGTQGGSRGELDLGLLLRKRASVAAASLRARPAAEKAAIVAGVLEHVWPLIAAGHVVPVVDRVLPLAEAAQAHRLMESGAHVGKILLAAHP